MSKTNGEGRSSPEKSGRMITPGGVRKEEAQRRAQEETDWAERSGPVTIRRKPK